MRIVFSENVGEKSGSWSLSPWKCPLEGYIPHVQTNQDAVSVILMVSTEETWERHRFRGGPSSIAHGFLYLCSLTSIHWYVSMKNDHLNKIVVRKILRKSVCGSRFWQWWLHWRLLCKGQQKKISPQRWQDQRHLRYVMGVWCCFPWFFSKLHAF